MSLFFVLYNNNIYYILLYTGLNFFLIGIYLSVFQAELFTAFLWLVECSVLFVFLLLLFYLNIKGTTNYTSIQTYQKILYVLLFIACILLVSYSDSSTLQIILCEPFNVFDNYYESILNQITNDLFGLSISYFTLNSLEFILVGFLLLVGSVICVNLYQINKNVRVQNYYSFLTIFNFFTNFSSFYFLRRQNITKQGNSKASLKLFKKK